MGFEDFRSCMEIDADDWIQEEELFLTWNECKSVGWLFL